MENRKGYGKRICLECGEEFLAGYAARVVCSEKCHKIRGKRQKAIRDKRYREKKKAELAELKIKLEECIKLSSTLQEENESLRKRIVELEQELRQANENLSSLREAGGGIAVGQIMKECKRMRLHATTLPCGQKAQCYQPKPCPRLPKELGSARKCVRCGNRFMPQSPSHRYCSEECAILAKIERNKYAQ